MNQYRSMRVERGKHDTIFQFFKRKGVATVEDTILF